MYTHISSHHEPPKNKIEGDYHWNVKNRWKKVPKIKMKKAPKMFMMTGKALTFYNALHPKNQDEKKWK